MFSESRILNLTGNTATVQSAQIARPEWARAFALSLYRVSAAPGTAASCTLHVQSVQRAGADFRNWASSAAFDLNSVAYHGHAFGPSPGAVAQYSATAPAALVGVSQILVPDVFRVELARATAQALDIDVWLQWLAGT